MIMESVRAETAFEIDLRKFLNRMRSGRSQVWIPLQEALHRRRPRSHFHATPELLIQTGGASVFECPADRFRMETWDACVMPRGVPHAEEPRDTRSRYGLLVCMHAAEGIYLLRGRTGLARRIEGFNSLFVRSSFARDAFRHLDELTKYLQLPEADRSRYVRALLETFLLTVLSSLAECPEAGASKALSSPLVQAAKEYIRTHLSDPELRVAGVAARLGCSVDHLSRVFRIENGQSLQPWILKERIDFACELLRDNRCNIAEVGWACGFNEPSYFIRVFHRQQGVTPLRFRMSAAGF